MILNPSNCLCLDRILKANSKISIFAVVVVAVKKDNVENLLHKVCGGIIELLMPKRNGFFFDQSLL